MSSKLKTLISEKIIKPKPNPDTFIEAIDKTKTSITYVINMSLNWILALKQIIQPLVTVLCT